MRLPDHAIFDKTTGRRCGTGSYDALGWCDVKQREILGIVPLSIWPRYRVQYKAWLKTDKQEPFRYKGR